MIAQRASLGAALRRYEAAGLGMGGMEHAWSMEQARQQQAYAEHQEGGTAMKKWRIVEIRVWHGATEKGP
jgi:nucleoside diphosphate kinase